MTGRNPTLPGWGYMLSWHPGADFYRGCRFRSRFGKTELRNNRRVSRHHGILSKN